MFLQVKVNICLNKLTSGHTSPIYKIFIALDSQYN